MNTNFTALTIELVVGFIALLLLTKITGKTQITQLTPFDFISALIIGELVGNAMYNIEIGVNYVLYAIFLWGSLTYLVEWITLKWKKTRGLIEGVPSIVVHRGIIDRKQLKKNRLDLNQLQHLLRDKGVFSMQEVEYAILESNGKVNVLKKFPYQEATKNDIQIKGPSTSLPIAVISDGEWIDENVRQTKYSKQYYIEVLQKHGLNVSHIIFGEWIENQPLYIQINHHPFVKKIEL
ncbi:DUF421 domain-containing protein [Evansella vedderi]|nr:DUF421 domain-containing protein [Evansella vedderi]